VGLLKSPYKNIDFIETPTMTKLTIDNVEYEEEALSDEAKAQFLSLKFCDAELERLRAQIAVVQTARVAYSNELKKLLPSDVIDIDTIKFN